MNPQFEDAPEPEPIDPLTYQLPALTEPEQFKQQLTVIRNLATTLKPVDELSLKRCAAFIETCKAAQKLAETRRKFFVEPLNKQVTDYNAIWSPLVKAWEETWRPKDEAMQRYVIEQRRLKDEEQRRLNAEAERERIRLKDEEDAKRRQAEQLGAAGDALGALKATTQADRLGAKAENVVTTVVEQQSRTLDLGGSTMSVAAPKEDWMLIGWDKQKPLSLMSPLLDVLRGDFDKLPETVQWLIRHANLNPVYLNASWKLPGAKFPKPFTTAEKFRASSLRTGKGE